MSPSDCPHCNSTCIKLWKLVFSSSLEVKRKLIDSLWLLSTKFCIQKYPANRFSSFRVNMKSYPGKVWMSTAQKWNKWLTHIEHRTGVAECPICDDPVSIWTGRSFTPLQKLRRNHQPYPNWFFEFQTRDIRSPSLPPKGALFAFYSTSMGIAREVDYRSRTWRFSNKAQLAFSAGVRLVSVGENQSD